MGAHSKPDQGPGAEEEGGPRGAHLCHALGCGRTVPPRFLMCPRHWGELPRWAQDLIWRFYRPGQERDKTPSPQYLIAQCLVVSHHAKARGVLSADDCAALLEATVRKLGMGPFEDVKRAVTELGGDGR